MLKVSVAGVIVTLLAALLTVAGGAEAGAVSSQAERSSSAQKAVPNSRYFAVTLPMIANVAVPLRLARGFWPHTLQSLLPICYTPASASIEV